MKFVFLVLLAVGFGLKSFAVEAKLEGHATVSTSTAIIKIKGIAAEEMYKSLSVKELKFDKFVECAIEECGGSSDKPILALTAKISTDGRMQCRALDNGSYVCEQVISLRTGNLVKIWSNDESL
jgi:hypothetical protein